MRKPAPSTNNVPEMNYSICKGEGPVDGGVYGDGLIQKKTRDLEKATITSSWEVYMASTTKPR